MNRIHDWAIKHHIGQDAMVDLLSLFTATPPPFTGGSEAFTQQTLRVTAPKLGGALWRNNSGAAIDDTGRSVRYGLANDSSKLNEVFKSSDLIGITPVNHAGRTFGVFTAVEVKEPGWQYKGTERETAQRNFLITVEAMGGIGMFATSVDAYLERVK